MKPHDTEPSTESTPPASGHVGEVAHQRLKRVQALAAGQGGVVSRRQVYSHGMTRGAVRAQIRAKRWQAIGSQCLATHCGPLPVESLHWAAVLEGGPRAHLDGASALIASGLSQFSVDRIRVSVPKGSRIRRRRHPKLDIRETRRYNPDEIVGSGIPRAKAAVAAIRAALWARSDRQASLLVTMTVQQGLCTVEQVAVALMSVKRDRRRALLSNLVVDLDGGIRSLGELDFVRGCHDRGIPAPDSQVLRKGKNKNYYMDFRWDEWHVVVEVDGIQHGWAQNAVDDALRHNVIATEGDVVLRLPVMGLRVCPDEFFDQIARALTAAGCTMIDTRSA